MFTLNSVIRHITYQDKLLYEPDNATDMAHYSLAMHINSDGQNAQIVKQHMGIGQAKREYLGIQ